MTAHQSAARAGRVPLRLLREVALTVGALAGVLCLLSTIAAITLDIKPVIFRSGSMAPAIETGALAFSRTVPAADLRVGDVVTVPSGTGELVTHRIQDVSISNAEANLVLRGDANAIADDRVYIVDSAPRVLFDIPKAGHVVAFATGPVGVFASGILVALMVLAIGRSWRANVERPGGEETAETDVEGPGVRAALTVGATVAIGLVVAAGAAGATDTLAYYQDSAAATSGTFSAPEPARDDCEELRPGALVCSNESPPVSPNRPAGPDPAPESTTPRSTESVSPDSGPTPSDAPADTVEDPAPATTEETTADADTSAQ